MNKDSSTGSKEEIDSKNLFHLKVYSPYKTYFEGDVSSLSALNETGPFDILAEHHNFLTLLLPCELTIRGIKNAPSGKEEKIKITRGIMQVKPRDVVVFLDI